jgi:hypothetical protein
MVVAERLRIFCLVISLRSGDIQMSLAQPHLRNDLEPSPQASCFRAALCMNTEGIGRVNRRRSRDEDVRQEASLQKVNKAYMVR